MQNACMPSITVRDVPDDARDALAARARRSGRSLQEYLRAELIAMADRPDMTELTTHIRARKQVTGTRLTADEILEHRDSDRR